MFVLFNVYCFSDDSLSLINQHISNDHRKMYTLAEAKMSTI